MNDAQLDEEFVKPRLKIKFWPLEKLRIWFNLVLGFIVTFPLFIALLERTPYNPMRSIFARFMEKDFVKFFVTMLAYNLIFSIIYLFEKAEINKSNELMKPEKRTRVFLVLLSCCVFHALWVFQSNLHL